MKHEDKNSGPSLRVFFQIKYRQDFNNMKGAAHYHSLPAQDNLVLKRAQSVNKLVSEVRMGDSHTCVPSPPLSPIGSEQGSPPKKILCNAT